MITKFKQWTFKCGLTIVSGKYSNELLDNLLYALYQGEFDIVPFGNSSPGNINIDNLDDQFQDSEYTYWQKLGIQMRSMSLSKKHSVPVGIVNALLRWNIALIDNADDQLSNLESLLSDCGSQYQIVLFTRTIPEGFDKSRHIQFRKKISIKKKEWKLLLNSTN